MMEVIDEDAPENRVLAEDLLSLESSVKPFKGKPDVNRSSLSVPPLDGINSGRKFRVLVKTSLLDGVNTGRKFWDLVKTSSLFDTLLDGINFGRKFWVIAVLILLSSFCAPYYLKPVEENKIEVRQELVRFVDSWISAFPKQDQMVWTILEAQIEEFLSKDNKSPKVFVFVHKEANRTAMLLANAVASAAVKLKHKEDKCGDSDDVKLFANDTRIKKGYLLENCLPEIERCNKFIVLNLEELTPLAAPDFLSLLDPDHTNVSSAVYIFLLSAPETSKKCVCCIVYEVLKKRWSHELNDDIIHPLISRLETCVKIAREPDLDP